MKDIATILNEAIFAKGWNISKTATQSEVNRSFLNRLLKGGHPPTLRDGPRTAAGLDDRYRRLAAALDLDTESFLKMVQDEQKKRVLKKSSSKNAPTPAGAIEDQAFSADFIRRHAQLYPIVAQHQLQGRSSLLHILHDAIDHLLSRHEASRWRLELRNLEDRRHPHSFSLTEHDHLGSRFHSAPSNARQDDAKTCLRFAEGLTDSDIGDVKHNLKSREAQIAISSLFYELAFILANQRN